MKKLAILSLLLTGMLACRPEPYEDIGQNYSLTEGIDGSWSLQKVEIEDLTLPVPEGRDITDYYLSDGSLDIQFDAETRTYTVSNPESPGNIFGSSGTFTFDDPEFPEDMSLTHSGGTITLSLTNMVRSIDNDMGLIRQRYKCGDERPYVNYRFTFNRVQQ